MFLLRTLVVILTLLASMQSLAGDLSSRWGPSKDEFIEMCSSVLETGSTEEIENSSCFIYFVGMRNGFLSGEFHTINRAGIYYHLDGDIPLTAEFDPDYIYKAVDMYDHTAYKKLDEYYAGCVNKKDPVVLLKEFIDFSEQIYRKANATVAFHEFLGEKYAGTC